ncbi:hypothetical protein C6P40_002851 [Pichia californica]|uniref:protein-tyrosine-phosphatase n=1 Tax=Pichia californica TaxID=460514 RepID=A0A9P6WJX7_9ASCO|nr:hypothetical protein C6P40_002851 [[Candida] californica]
MLNSANNDFTFPANTPLTSTPSHMTGMDYFTLHRSTNANTNANSNSNSSSSSSPRNAPTSTSTSTSTSKYPSSPTQANNESFNLHNHNKNISNNTQKENIHSRKSSNSSSIITIPSVSTINKHKRSLENSLFNSDSTVVESDLIPDSYHTSTSSSNNTSNINIDLNLNRNDSYDSTISDYSTHSLSINNRSSNIRSKFTGLGHRTSKSENFTLKLSKKQDSKKSITQLNDLHEESSSTSDDNLDNNDNDDFNDEIGNNLPSASLKSSNQFDNNDNKNDFKNKSISNNNINNNNNNNNNNNIIKTQPLNNIHNLSFTDYSKNYFDPLPTAPVNSKNNFSLFSPITSTSALASTLTSSSSTSTSSLSPSASLFTKKQNHLLSCSSSLTTSSHISKSNNLSSDSLPARAASNKLRNSKLKLPSKIHLLNIHDAESSINKWSKSLGSDYLSNLLIIDVRPFHDYCKSHLKNSINICLPSTLLKRQTFTLEKCIQTLTSNEKNLFNKYSQRNLTDLPNVLFYDNYNSSENDISSSIFYLAGKFIQNSNWNSQLYILGGGYTNFIDKHTNLIDNDTNPNNIIKLMLSSDENVSSSSINSETFSPSSTMISPQSLASPGFLLTKPVMPHNNKFKCSKSPIGLSRFVLPDSSSLPVFKTRGYDELITSKTDSSIHLSTILTQSELSSLPVWLRDVFGNDLGSTELTEKFNKLQISERNRLNHALNKTDISNEKSTDDSPIISAGVELGRKNRYKDIFLYEHARVKLEKYDTNSEDLNAMNSYINASYIHYPNSDLNYIATQGPLNETIGDFWNVIYYNNVPIILSLTPQSENQIEKCAPFWEPDTYYSNGVKIEINLIEQIDNIKLSSKSTDICILRRISIKLGSKPIKEVLQLHMTSWPDFGIVICEEDILSVVSLKKYICEKLNIKSKPVLVHCSAGCGRTGSFCVIDTCIDILFNKLNNVDNSEDLIYDITSKFRSQRVFMVQTLRQYIFIYDAIIKFIKRKEITKQFGIRGDIDGDILTTEGLVDWEIKDPGIIQRFIEAYRS